MDHGNFTCPDTYTRHKHEVPEELADPTSGIEKLKAGLNGTKAA